MSTPDTITEVIILQEPEDLDADRFSQPSVVERAKLFQSSLARYAVTKDALQSKGLVFGGRVLLTGAPGTDFEGFVHHVAFETPMKIIRLNVLNAIGGAIEISEAIRTLVEIAKRNSPALVYLEKIDTLSEKGKDHTAVLLSALKETSWDENEIILVGATSYPERIEEEILSAFDRVYIFKQSQMDERVKVFEALLDGRKDIDPTLLGEMTEGWGFSDLVHLSAGIIADVPAETNIIPRSKLEQIMDQSGLIGISRKEVRDGMSFVSKGSSYSSFDAIDTEYPDDFLDQLYLMAVGDDFQGTQRVIESLNNNLPLTQADSTFLSKYPFLLTGTAEDRLTRLMRAKRTNDRLSRIMGR